MVKARRLDYYRYMAEGGPKLAVVEDSDGAESIGAFWGEVNTTLHKGLGLAGALTNGVMRDLDDMAAGFPVVAGSIGPSHGFVHVTDVDLPVQIFGLWVKPGELVHADRHGALVIPEEVIGSLSQSIATLQASEALILDPARAPGFDIEALELAWRAFEQART